MAAFLEKLGSLYSVSRNPPSTTVSISSRWQPLSDQTTGLAEDGTPIIAPLRNLDQVLSWVPGHDELCVPSVYLNRSSSDAGRQCQDGAGLMSNCEAHKMIVCHDMMGGYNKDKYVQGQRELEDFYFYDWSHIGAFIYFSHHLISLPPPGWTNAAHRNGVLSMGTIITEWQEGAKVCHRLLSDEFMVMQFAQQLVAMAQYYRFDGWLVNIENEIHPMLLERVYMLLSLLTTGMHDACPGSKVIWYDSVTIDGKLRWQNQLNQLNKSFFDVCDGIFLNYNWSDSGLSSSRFLARERQGEVYVGIDVFGRGCYGYRDRELGFDSNKALEAINHHGLSSALFAPGWVFENQDKKNFFNNQDRFWSLLGPLCPTACLTGLPLVSSFGRGCGERMVVDGKVVYSGTWSNHSAQDLQPSFLPASVMLKNDLQSAVMLYRAIVDTSIAYNNGACLKLEGALKKTAGLSKPSLARLFKTDIPLSDPLLIVFTFNADQPSSSSAIPKSYKYFLQLHTSGSPSRVFLDPLAKPIDVDSATDLLKGCGLPRSRDVPHLPGCVLSPLPEQYSNTLHEIFTGSSEQTSPWKTCYFVVDRDDLKGSRLTEISLGFYVAGADIQAGETVTLTVGEIKVLDLNCISSTFDLSTISNIWCNDVKVSDDRTSLSLTLFWSTSDNPQDPIDHCNIYSSNIIGSTESVTESPWRSDYVYLGRAYSNGFRVTDLYVLSSDLNETPFSLEFRVQPVTASRRKPRVGDSECLVVKLAN